MEYIKSKIRDVYDFPKPGIIFRDLTTMFKDPRAMHIVGWDLAQLYRDKGVTKVVGIESRGFIGGAILAYEIGAGFVPARKPGKLPADTVSASFEKEYGPDTIEIHRRCSGAARRPARNRRHNGRLLRTRQEHESAQDLHKLHRRAKRIERSQKPPRRCRCKIAYRLLKQKDNPFG